MSWVLIKVFFGSSYIGFDIMYDINIYLGPPLMIIFVVMTQILLVTSLISILSDSFSKVISHARFVISCFGKGILLTEIQGGVSLYLLDLCLGSIYEQPTHTFLPTSKLNTIVVYSTTSSICPSREVRSAQLKPQKIHHSSS